MHYSTDPCRPKPKKVNMKAAVAKVAAMSPSEVVEASKRNKAEQRAAKKSTAPRIDGDGQRVTSRARAQAGRSGRAPLAGSLPEQETNAEPGEGTRVPPVDTSKRRGRPSTITDMAAYKAQKQREYRQRVKLRRKP